MQVAQGRDGLSQGHCAVMPPANALEGTAALADQTWRGGFRGCGPLRTVPCSLRDTPAVDSPSNVRVSGYSFLLDQSKNGPVMVFLVVPPVHPWACISLCSENHLDEALCQRLSSCAVTGGPSPCPGSLARKVCQACCRFCSSQLRAAVMGSWLCWAGTSQPAPRRAQEPRFRV